MSYCVSVSALNCFVNEIWCHINTVIIIISMSIVAQLVPSLFTNLSLYFLLRI